MVKMVAKANLIGVVILIAKAPVAMTKANIRIFVNVLLKSINLQSQFITTIFQ